MGTDLDYTNNCVFIDEAAFHFNLKRSFAWSKKGTSATVKVPKRRAKTTTILGAISPYGIVNISVRRLRATAPSKKKEKRLAVAKPWQPTAAAKAVQLQGTTSILLLAP